MHKLRSRDGFRFRRGGGRQTQAQQFITDVRTIYRLKVGGDM